METLIDGILARNESVALKQAEAIIEIGKGTQEIAKAQARWFALFEQHMGEGESHTLRPEDEWRDAEKRAREEVARLLGQANAPGSIGIDERAVAQIDALMTFQERDN